MGQCPITLFCHILVREEITRTKFNTMIGLEDRQRVDEALYDDFESEKAREVRWAPRFVLVWTLWMYWEALWTSQTYLFVLFVILSLIKLYDFGILRNAWPRKHVSKKLKLKTLHLGRKLRRLHLFEEKVGARLHFSKWLARYCRDNVIYPTKIYFLTFDLPPPCGCRIMVEVCHMMISQICLGEVGCNGIFNP